MSATLRDGNLSYVLRTYRSQTSSSLFSALFTRKGPSPHLFSQSNSGLLCSLCSSWSFWIPLVLYPPLLRAPYLTPQTFTSKNFLSPALRNLSFLNITFHHGGIRTVPDLRHNLRDHKPVRPSRSLSVGSCQIRLLIFATSRYTDLQPVGMGAFGLVWYVIVNRVLLGSSCRTRNIPPLTGR